MTSKLALIKFDIYLMSLDQREQESVITDVIFI